MTITGKIQYNLSPGFRKRQLTCRSGSISADDLCARILEVQIRGTPESAIESQRLAREAVTLYPGLNWGRMALIVALKETGEHKEAAEQYYQLFSRTQNFDARFFGRRWSSIPAICDLFQKALTALGMG